MKLPLLKLPFFAGLALLSLTALPLTAHAAPAAPKSGVLSYTVPDIAGKPVPLSRYSGKVLLIVNTASLCGNTPQYKSLEALYEKYKSRGLRILAFPANDFAQQEPGSNAEIHQFCTSKYQTSFDLFSKLSVKAPHQAPLYTFLTSRYTDPQFGGDIEWNFAKFLVDRHGKVVARFPAGHDPLSPDVIAAVETELNKPVR
jgi:glutathione peroxidase